MTTNSPTPSQQWSLVALSPELGDLSVPLGVSTSVGRHQDNDIVLATQQISRQHAKFNQIGSSLVLQDLGSSNGTFVNGERIATEAVELTTGDEVAFADILFVITNEAANEAVSLVENIADKPDMSQVKTTIENQPETESLTEVVSLPATVIASSNEVEQLEIADKVETDKIATVETSVVDGTPNPEPSIPSATPAQSASQPTVKTEIVSTEPEVVQPELVKPEVIKPLSDTMPTATKPTNLAESTPSKHTLTEQVISPIAPTGSVDSHPSTMPKKAPVQTWLVAIVIVILIVLAIIGTLFLK